MTHNAPAEDQEITQADRTEFAAQISDAAERADFLAGKASPAVMDRFAHFQTTQAALVNGWGRRSPWSGV